MNTNASRFDRLISALLPLPFVAVGFLNILYFVVFQERFSLLRKLFVFGTEGTVALLLFWNCARLYRTRPKLRRTFLCACCIPLLLGLLYGWKLLTGDTAFWAPAVVHGCTLVSCLCAALTVWAEQRGAAFLRTGRRYTLIAAPVLVFYCVRFYASNIGYQANYLGVLDYMSLAYTCLTLMLFPLGAQLFYPEDPLNRKFRRLDGGLCLLYSIAITLSGTKGTMLCMLFGAVLAAGYAAPVLKQRAVQYPAAALTVVLLFSTVLYPVGVESRLMTFVKEGNSVEVGSNDIESVSQDIHNAQTGDEPKEPEMSAEPETPPEPSSDGEETIDVSGIGDVVSYVLNGDAERDYQAGRLSAESYTAVQEMCTKINNTATGARKYLWTCAFNEIRSAPLTGHGIMAFQSKYGAYPHNLFLELATDWGLPVTLAVALFGLYVFLRLLRNLRRDPLADLLVFYVLLYLPQQMVSDTLYSDGPFFQYGLCILLAFSACQPLFKRRFSPEIMKKEPSCEESTSTPV